MPSSLASGVTAYWGNPRWNACALLTFSRLMTDRLASSLLGILLATHSIFSLTCATSFARRPAFAPDRSPPPEARARHTRYLARPVCHAYVPGVSKQTNLLFAYQTKSLLSHLYSRAHGCASHKFRDLGGALRALRLRPRAVGRAGRLRARPLPARMPVFRAHSRPPHACPLPARTPAFRAHACLPCAYPSSTRAPTGRRHASSASCPRDASFGVFDNHPNSQFSPKWSRTATYPAPPARHTGPKEAHAGH